MIILYTKENCSSCESTKQLLTSNETPYTEQKIGSDISVEDLLKLYPGVKVAPVIVVDGRLTEVGELKSQLLLG